MQIVICPGIHQRELTQRFIEDLWSVGENNLNNLQMDNMLVFPEEGILTLSTFHILLFLGDRLGNRLELPVIFIGFSAGVVGAMGAAIKWQMRGGNVKALIAIDGWGVPVGGNFPIHRLSHDYFTHWSSAILGSKQDNFYADPPVEHLSMWGSPGKVQGYWQNLSTGFSRCPTYLSATEFLHLLLKSYDSKL